MIEYKLIGSTHENIIDCVLENRELTRDEVNNILEPNIEEYDGMLFRNMQRGIDVLYRAINSNFTIGIVVDPDCDGDCSTGMIQEFINKDLNYSNTKLFFHEERVKSHGIDEDIYNQITNSGATLIIIPDAGSTLQDYEYMQELNEEYGVEFLVLDHHNVEYQDHLDDLVLINYNHPECNYPNPYLSGAGVTYKYIQAYAKQHDVDTQGKYIDLAALSLVSDMMNLRDSLENRVILNNGSLKSNIISPLLKQFIDSKKLKGDKISIEDYAFSIASLINATIREGSQEDKEMLLKSFYGVGFVQSNKRGNYGALEDIQQEIMRRMGNNKAKQDKPVKIATEKILQYIEDNNMLNDKVIMLDVTKLLDDSVTGLVGNKLISALKRPIMLYRDRGEELVGGSCRGLKVDSFKDICLQSNLFTFCSGHNNSFGHSIPRENLPKLKEYFNTTLKDLEIEDIITVDAAYQSDVPLEDIKDICLIWDLWCNNIKEPQFLIKDILLDPSKIMKIGNAEYCFRIGNMSYNKKFCSKVWIEEFAKQELTDSNKREKYPFKSSTLHCDLIVKFKQNDKGYYYMDIVDAKSRIIEI
ncbi:MAG: DHH family phosphoesterase [Paraclostridium sp.]